MNKITGTFKDNNFFGLISSELGDLLVEKGNFGDAKDGDIVEAVNISENPNILSYKVINVINDVKEIVSNTITGLYKQIDKDKGVISISGKTIYVNSNNSMGALTGDEVKLFINENGKRTEGIISEITSFRKNSYLGKIDIKGGKYFVHLTEPSFDKQIPLSINSGIKPNKGDTVKFRLDRNDSKNIFGIFDGIFGKDGDKDMDIFIKAAEKGVKIEFPKDVLEEVDNMSEEITKEEIEKRIDLREQFVIAIDGPDTKDRDDAIAIEDLGNGKYKLFVHIADVSHFVKEETKLYDELNERGTSFYLIDKVIPMLPEKLSNNLCSLNPNEDKLTKTCEMIINSDGSIDFESVKVYKSIINSNYSTTYKEVDELSNGIFKGETLNFGGEITNTLKDFTKIAKNLAGRLNNKLKLDGELKFDSRESKFEVDAKGKILGVKEYGLYESNEWIKAFMVAANQAVSFKFNNYPFLYRTHETPSDFKIIELNQTLNYFGIKLESGSSKSIGELLDKIKGLKEEKFLRKTILKSLTKAIYTHDDNGHHGLALNFYSHFTSPIRRGPDYIIHLIIDYILEGKDVTHFNDILEGLAEHFTNQEKLQEDVQKYINEIKSIEYLDEDLEMEYSGEIVELSDFGYFIELDNTIVGNLMIDSSYKRTELCKGLNEFQNKRGDKISVGDKIKVKVQSLDKDKLKIIFKIV